MAEKTFAEVFAETRAALKPAKPFRWLGPGVLHILRNDMETIKVIPPEGPETSRACIVRDPENLKAISQERVDALVKEGKAEYITLGEGAMDLLKPSPSTDSKIGDMADVKQAEEIAQGAVSESNSRFRQSKALKDAGDPKASSPVPPLTEESPSVDFRSDAVKKAAGAGPKK